jgi:prevent-host-death family protein
MYRLEAAMTKYVGAAEFKAKCLKLIDEMQNDGETITITKRGKPVATMSAVKEEKRPLKPLFGALKGSVLKYDDPFEPAVDPAEWDANNPAELYQKR